MKKWGAALLANIIVAISLAAVLCPLVDSVQAMTDEVAVSPRVFDERGGNKEIIDRKIIIKNNSKGKVELYVVIADIDKSGSKALSDCLEISRGVISLDAGEERSLPLKIVTGNRLLPGQYHAQIIFSRGSNRWEAEANSANSLQPRVLINFNVEEKIVEKLNNQLFRTVRSINIDKKVNFLYRLKNIGNVPQTPTGSIVIYNRNGSEVASLLVNNEGSVILPDEQNEFLSSWDANGKIGKYKARLDVVYGRNNDKNASDIYYFWLIPRWLLYLLLGILGLLGVILAYLFFKVSRQGALIIEEEYNHIIDLKSRINK